MSKNLKRFPNARFYYHYSKTTPIVGYCQYNTYYTAEMNSTTFFKTHVMEINDINFLLYFLVLFLFKINFYEMSASKIVNKYFVVI